MKNLTLLLATALLLGACKKDSDNTPTKADLLTAKNWRVAAMTYTSTAPGSGPATIDGYASVSACEKDDFIKFDASKTLIADQGATKCDPLQPQTKTGSWSFNGDYTTLNVYNPWQSGGEAPYQVIELSANTLYLRSTATSSAGGTPATVTYDVVYKAF